MPWQNATNISPQEFKCGYCGNIVASNLGFSTNDGRNKLYICPYCENPSFIDSYKNQTPGVASGNEVQNLPEDLETLYRESRNCISVGACTASVLACRKLLMNIAVAQGAEEGKSFLSYVEYLANNGFVPPNGRGWVDHIRKKGNEATHEIALMSQPDAEELISFTEMLLKFIYEFPARVPQPE